MTPPDAPASRPTRSGRVNLETVAREAQVSLATASRTLGGRTVSPLLRERVEHAVARLGYHPDLAAQAVARGTTKTVALIVDHLRSPFGVEITRGVVDAASAHGLVVNVTGSETQPGDLLERISNARALRPRSLVLATGLVQNPGIRTDLVRTLEAYQEAGGSVAIIDGPDLPFASCSFDETTAAHALARNLVDLGYRRPLVFNSSSERADLAERMQALCDGLETAGIAPSTMRRAELTTAVSSTTVDRHLLDLGDADVVLCIEGAIVPAVYRHIRARGLRVGADVGVTAFGQYGFADALRPHLTTVMLPLRRAGALAVEHALTDTAGAHLSLPGNLRIRASTPRRTGATRQRWIAAPDRAPLRSVGVVVPPLPATETGIITQEFLALARSSSIACAILSEESALSPVSPALGRYDALLVWGPLSTALAAHLRDAALRSVIVDAPSDGPAVRLSVEMTEGMQLLLEHLYALGHTSIAYLASPQEDPAEVQRRRALELFAVTHDDVRLHVARTTQATGVSDATNLVEHRAVTAVVAHDDLQAAEIVGRLRATGHAVPGDVSVAGFGGGMGELTEPAVTTVRLDPAAAARAAWRLLGAHVTPAESPSLALDLLVRESTGPAPRQS